MRADQESSAFAKVSVSIIALGTGVSNPALIHSNSRNLQSNSKHCVQRLPRQKQLINSEDARKLIFSSTSSSVIPCTRDDSGGRATRIYQRGFVDM